MATRDHAAHPLTTPDPEAAERAETTAASERVEQRSLLRGLLLVGALVLAFSILRAGWPRVFVQGWWKQW